VYGDRALVGRVQFIDVRDLAAWFADDCHAGTGGVYNLTGTFVPFGGMLGLCQAAVHGEAELGWIPSERLVAAGVDPGMGIPLWIAEPGCEAINDVDSSRAVAAGLACRPATDTIRDTLASAVAANGRRGKRQPDASCRRLRHPGPGAARRLRPCAACGAWTGERSA